MNLSRWQRSALVLSILLASLLSLVSCGGSTTPPKAKPATTPTPTAGPGQQLLTKMATTINTAKSLHGLFNLTVTSPTESGTANSEIWRVLPNKSRVEVHQSTISQVTTGSVTVADGKQIWQYDPAKNVVYNGPVSASTSSAQNAGIGGGAGGGQSQFLLNIVQIIFSQSDGTLRPDTNVAGHNVYDVHVVPQGNSSGNDLSSFSYSGEVYIDKGTQLPINVDLDIQGLGKVVMDLPTFELNPTIPDSTFTFVVPADAKVLPLQQTNTGGGSNSLSLAQAQQQAGYHLFSIPGDQSNYVLEGVTALGAPGSETYSLHYMKGNQSFTIVEGKSLANLPSGSGQQVQVRGVTGTLSGSGNNTTLAWTEKGVGIRITGAFDKDQLISLANTLS